MDSQTSNQALSIILGLVGPLLVSALKNETWEKWKKLTLVIAVSCACAIFSSWITGDFDTRSFRESVPVVLSVMWASYNYFWENTEINKRLTDVNLVDTATKAVTGS